MIKIYFLFVTLSALFYLFLSFEKYWHLVFLKTIRKEQATQGQTTKERMLSGKYKEKHLKFFLTYLLISILIYLIYSHKVIDVIFYENIYTISLITITAILVSSLASFDFRMRLLPDSFIIGVAITSLFLLAIYLYNSYMTVDYYLFKQALVAELEIKMVYLILGIISIVLFFIDKLDIGFGDIKFFLAISLLPNEWVSIPILILSTAVLALFYLLINQKIKLSKIEGVPLVSLMVLVSPLTFFIK